MVACRASILKRKMVRETNLNKVVARYKNIFPNPFQFSLANLIVYYATAIFTAKICLQIPLLPWYAVNHSQVQR